MNNKSTWAILGAIVLVGGALFVAQLSAQRAQPRPEVPIAPFGPVGRFTQVKVESKQILLLDTVTGEVYLVSEGDVKKSSERPKVGPWPQPMWGKEGPAKERSGGDVRKPVEEEKPKIETDPRRKREREPEPRRKPETEPK